MWISIFPTFEAGFKGCIKNLQGGYANKRLSEVFQIYAPADKYDNPAAYFSVVQKMTGIAANKMIKEMSVDELQLLAKAIMKVEGYSAPIVVKEV